MPYNLTLRLTLEHLPPEVGAALRTRAAETGRSLENMALSAIADGLERPLEPSNDIRKGEDRQSGNLSENAQRNLADFVGMWREEPWVDVWRQRLAETDRLDMEIQRADRP